MSKKIVNKNYNITAQMVPAPDVVVNANNSYFVHSFRISKNLFSKDRMNLYQIEIGITEFDLYLLQAKKAYLNIKINNNTDSLSFYLYPEKIQFISRDEETGIFNVSIIGVSAVLRRLTYENILHKKAIYNQNFTSYQFFTEVLLNNIKVYYGNYKLDSHINKSLQHNINVNNVSLPETFTDKELLNYYLDTYIPVLDETILYFDDFSGELVFSDSPPGFKVIFESLNSIFDSGGDKFQGNPTLTSKYFNILLTGFGLGINSKVMPLIPGKSYFNIAEYQQKAGSTYIKTTINAAEERKLSPGTYKFLKYGDNDPGVHTDKFFEGKSGTSIFVNVPIDNDKIKILRNSYARLSNLNYFYKRLYLDNFNIYSDIDINKILDFQESTEQLAKDKKAKVQIHPKLYIFACDIIFVNQMLSKKNSTEYTFTCAAELNGIDLSVL